VGEHHVSKPNAAGVNVVGSFGSPLLALLKRAFGGAGVLVDDTNHAVLAVVTLAVVVPERFVLCFDNDLEHLVRLRLALNLEETRTESLVFRYRLARLPECRLHHRAAVWPEAPLNHVALLGYHVVRFKGETPASCSNGVCYDRECYCARRELGVDGGGRDRGSTDGEDESGDGVAEHDSSETLDNERNGANILKQINEGFML
jgi:hypothetical protein